jgi:large subunit ribosomal protein L21
VGDSVTFDQVLLVRAAQGAEAKLGDPLVSGAAVTGKIVGTAKDAKVLIYKKRRRKGYTKKQGHRQARTVVLIENIAA